MYAVSSVASPLELGAFWEFTVALDAGFGGHFTRLNVKWAGRHV